MDGCGYLRSSTGNLTLDWGAKLKAKLRAKLKAKLRRKLKANRPTTHQPDIGGKAKAKPCPKLILSLCPKLFRGYVNSGPPHTSLTSATKLKAKAKCKGKVEHNTA